MATNLRLRPSAEAALREASVRTGRSQQDLIREAIDRFLDVERAASPDDLESLVAAGLVVAARTPYRRATVKLVLPDGMTSADLLDREDRF